MPSGVWGSSTRHVLYRHRSAFLARPIQLVMILLLILSALFTTPAYAQAMPEGWQFRRTLNFKLPASDAPGDPVVYAEFYTNGQRQPDGSDLRVTNPQRLQAPMRVLQVSADNDFVRIAFAPTRGEGPYYAWWGNPQADKTTAPPPPLEIKRGILAEIFRNPGGALDNEQRIRHALERAAGGPEGALFVPEIFLGYNPLGAEWDTLIRYSTAFKVGKTDSYDLAFTVEEAGYLNLDGHTLIFQQGLVRDARRKQTLELTAGWHTLEVTQVKTSGGNTGVSLSWRPGGMGKYTPIPAANFAPVSEATVGPLETLRQPFTADFLITPAAEIFVPPEHFAPRYVFDAQLPEGFKQAALRWDFGDGQTASLARVHHYFLYPGTYTVSLTVKPRRDRGGGLTYTTKQRISVRDRLYERFPVPLEDGLKTASVVLTNYNLPQLTVEQLLRGLLFFKRHNAKDEMLRWGQAWLQSPEPQNERVVWQETFDLARLLESRNLYREAAEAWRLASQKRLTWEMRSTLLRWQVVTLCDDLDDAGHAYAAAEEMQKTVKDPSDATRRALGAALVYAAVDRGEGKLAARLAKEIGPVQPSFERQKLEQGILARNIEAAISAKEFDHATELLQQWEWEFPQAIVEGYSRLLKYRLRMAEGQPLLAARCALAHAKGVPNSYYAAELLYRASEAFKAAGKAADATAVLELLTSKYPESPYAQKDSPATQR